MRSFTRSEDRKKAPKTLNFKSDADNAPIQGVLFIAMACCDQPMYQIIISISTRYEHRKDNAKCRKCGRLG